MPIKSRIKKVDIAQRLKNNLGKKGLKIKRIFTHNPKDIFADIKFEKRTSKIVNADGSIVFEMKNVEVPQNWSQVATDVLAENYLRKKGVPQKDKDGKIKKDKEGNPILGGENSIKDIAYRLAATWRWWGEKHGYFDSKKDAQAFEDEVQYMIVNQIAVPNSPQWYNTGLAHVYGLTGTPQGHYFVDPQTQQVKKSEDAYTHPQPHACFIQDVNDDLVNEGGIFDLVVREARLFKYGSGTGTNFSKVRGRGELLSGGGKSSGLLSFLKVLDAGAGSIKSGGTTRRAAKMVTVDIDHPEVEDFISWKAKEEQKVASLVTGSYINQMYLKQIMQLAQDAGIDPVKNPELKKKIYDAKKLFVPLNYIKRVLLLVENGYKVEDFKFDTYDSDYRSEAYRTVDGQNSNNSVRVTNDFMFAVENDATWDLINRTDGKASKTLQARNLWKSIIDSAWACADPGLQFHTTINQWHTCPKDGEIRGSNPCSEYMFLDETACNLYQMNLSKFYNEKTFEFDTEKFQHVVRLSTIILEISVLMSQLPSKIMAERTFEYRTLGLGYANLGSLLMRMGVAYDSNEGFAITGVISAIMSAEAYTTSAEMASVVGPFVRYKPNKSSMLKVIKNHRLASYNADKSEYTDLTIYPKGIDSKYVDSSMLKAAQKTWDIALEFGKQFGYRNAQVSALAPTGTTGLVMDCDTTGMEPDFALVKFKKLAGGGYLKIINQAISPALKKMGYSEEQKDAIIHYAIGHQSLQNSPQINYKSLQKLGFTSEILDNVEKLLPSIFELKYAFTKWTLGEEFCVKTLKLEKAKLNDPNSNLLLELGFSLSQIEEANEYICGTMTIEGAPYLKEEHLSVFDCANKCGQKGKRFIRSHGHILQMASAQPFISGAISKTINMPENSSLKDIEDAYTTSWKSMLKAIALYRDNSKLSQPLNSKGEDNSVYSKLFDFSDMDTLEKKETNKNNLIKADIPKIVNKPIRTKLPDERHSITHKFAVAGHKGYITVGLYEDGTPGEIFVSMNKQGSTLSGIMDAWATSVSFSLQYGVPIEEIIRKLVYTRFNPSGPTSNPEIPVAQSIMDYIGRWLALRFLSKDKAKRYHNAMLVDKSYSEGTRSRIMIPYINGKGHTEIMTDSFDEIVAHQIQKGIDSIGENQVEVTFTKTKTHEIAMESTELQVNLDIGHTQQQLALRMNNDDAPMCSECGSITVRNGSCYKCLNCGSTTGCS
jgi:ribonucleoside-diphosphate reductase alpha chain